ncbi:MAG: 16S rRNA (guanine(966)-N(2))-methyltransferase RsmD [Desulfobacteraceae bacterium]|nr:16S rRNA (guanine(966)-N(2))-methyltransferase RsmD [Desulfobacteraceae bacterium]MBC2720563.1 16S rRNA (guanine(966)-N(2))-methyltransferase RsmD [Desulfobacteraceae bacterium]
MGLRIIGGELRGKKLYTIPGTLIRPTADRLRESIFDILSYLVKEAVVLELFAGTGALGIEALSRGANSAVFIDNNKKALSVVERNIQSCAVDSRSQIIRWNIVKNLKCIKSVDSQFNLVFMDPPYNNGLIKPTLINLYNSGSLGNDACIIVEHTPFEPVPAICKPFELVDQRKYGKKLISFIKERGRNNFPK